MIDFARFPTRPSFSSTAWSWTPVIYTTLDPPHLLQPLQWFPCHFDLFCYRLARLTGQCAREVDLRGSTLLPRLTYRLGRMQKGSQVNTPWPVCPNPPTLFDPRSFTGMTPKPLMSWEERAKGPSRLTRYILISTYPASRCMIYMFSESAIICLAFVGNGGSPENWCTTLSRM